MFVEVGVDRLQIEVTAGGKGKTQFHFWKEHPPEASLNHATNGVTANFVTNSLSDTLTPREREVALLVADGLRSREVAERLGIASQTVKSHLKTIFDKLGVSDRLELALYAIHKGLHLTGEARS